MADNQLQSRLRESLPTILALGYVVVYYMGHAGFEDVVVFLLVMVLLKSQTYKLTLGDE